MPVTLLVDIEFMNSFNYLSWCINPIYLARISLLLYEIPYWLLNPVVLNAFLFFPLLLPFSWVLGRLFIFPVLKSMSRISGLRVALNSILGDCNSSLFSASITILFYIADPFPFDLHLGTELKELSTKSPYNGVFLWFLHHFSFSLEALSFSSLISLNIFLW